MMKSTSLAWVIGWMLLAFSPIRCVKATRRNIVSIMGSGCHDDVLRLDGWNVLWSGLKVSHVIL